MPQWNLLLLLMMMMTTVIISVELEGVFTQTDRQTESAGDCGLEKKLPSSNSSSSTLGLLFLVVVLSKITTEEISSLC